MIRENSIELLNDLLGKIISYGFINDMNLNSIESKLINSSIIRNLENGDDSFLYNNFNEDVIISNVYGVTSNTKFNTITIANWIAEGYLNIFFRYKKSFSFIFLYLPIKTMKFLFNKYHEISFDYLNTYFLKVTKENTILRLLIKKKNVTQAKLAVLTGININAIYKYNIDNKYIYGAGFDNIYQISRVLEVNSNIFLKHLEINTDTSIYKFDKNNPIYRSFLGLYYLSFYDSKIASINWIFNKDNNYFYSGNNKKIFVRFDTKKNNLLKLAKDLSKKINNKKNIILCLFDYEDKTFDNYDCKLFKDFCFKNIYIINQLGILNTNNGDVMVLIDKYNINENIINRAKDSANEFLKDKI